MKWTTTAAAKEFGTSRETLIRGLRGMGENPKEGSKYTTLQCHRALSGDLKAERIRETRARADKLEMDNQEQRGATIRKEAAKELIRKHLGPVRAFLETMPAVYGHRANPNDHILGRGVFKEAADEGLAKCNLTNGLPEDLQ